MKHITIDLAKVAFWIVALAFWSTEIIQWPIVLLFAIWSCECKVTFAK